jgi:Ca2+:H+ antiporter
MEGGYTEFRDENSPPSPTLKSSIKATLTLSWLNLLLVFVPIGYMLGLKQAPEPLVFVINCLGIIPLAGLLGFATEEVFF